MYKHTLLTYIDILGFKNMIDNWPPTRIDKCMRTLATESQRESDDFFKWVHDLGVEYHTVHFSDLILRFYQFSEEPDSDHLHLILSYETENLAKIQRELPVHEFLIRGAIDYGRLSYTGGRVFGPVLVSAYLLERDVAKQPRIILSPSLGENLTNLIQEITEKEESERSLAEVSALLSYKFMKKEPNGPMYINYAVFDPEDYGHYLSTEDEFFESHFNLIQKTLKSETDPGVISKYQWLRDLHNAAYLKMKKKYPEMGNFEL